MRLKVNFITYLDLFVVYTQIILKILISNTIYCYSEEE